MASAPTEPPLSLESLLIHADDHFEKDPDIAPPIHVATTFETPNGDHLIYSRETHLTRARVEKVIGDLEGGHAVMFSSGMAAIFTLLLHMHPKRVVVEGGYHGTHKAIALCARQVGSTTYFKGPEPLSSQPQEGDLWWLEVPRNATCEVVDIAAIVKQVHAVRGRVAVDATFATPILLRSLALGVDAVVHSTTKFMNGHSDGLGGVIVAPNYQLANTLSGLRSTMGNVPGSLECWLLLRSLRTLSLRVNRQSATATAVAHWLSKNADIAKAYHPSLPGCTGHELVGPGKMMSAGGGVLSLETSNPAHAPVLAKKLRLFRHATSLGGVESLVDYRFRFAYLPDSAINILQVGSECEPCTFASFNRFRITGGPYCGLAAGTPMLDALISDTHNKAIAATKAEFKESEPKQTDKKEKEKAKAKEKKKDKKP